MHLPRPDRSENLPDCFAGHKTIVGRSLPPSNSPAELGTRCTAIALYRITGKKLPQFPAGCNPD
jgi:hypothetical protein